MTINPLIFFTIVGLGVISILLFLRFWQFLNSMGIKDNKYPIVQHAKRKEKEEKKEVVPYLPGSKIGEDYGKEDTQYVEDIMEKGLFITQFKRKKNKKKRHPFVRDLMDIRRAIILDDLLDRKWNKENPGDRGENNVR